jgi:hypothetical protein
LQKAFQAEIAKQKPKVMIEVVRRLKLTTPVDTGEARDGWRIEGDKIINDVEHINRLNEGTSQQAPARFIEATVMSVPGVKLTGAITRSS